MTPLILVILAAMWAAVLLPPYLRDRNESRPAGGRSPMNNRIDALTSSVSRGSSYLPVQGSGQSAAQVPLPHGAKRPVVAHAAASGPERLPQSSAVQVLDPHGQRPEPTDGHVTQLRPVEPTAPAVEPVLDLREDAPIETRSASSFARQRRRNVLHALIAVAGVTLLAAVAVGGPVLFVNLLADAALIGYVYLLIQRNKVHAEQEMKVAFLPHGSNGASATALLEQGGGWNPGRVENLRVVQAEAN